MAGDMETILTELLALVVERSGLFLEGIETTRAGRHSAVRVLVDLPDGEGDLDLEALTGVTATVSQALDDADPIKGQYNLEVSTPGAERELSTPRHFRRAVGHHARITAGEETLTGRVLRADEETLTLTIDGAERTVPLARITAARMVVII